MANEFRVKNGIISHGDIVPDGDSTRDLGTSSLYFAEAYIDKLTTTGVIELGHASQTTLSGSGGTLSVEGTAVVLAGGANHDGFSDFVANEHIDHSGVTITAGTGMTGGGTIAATRTLNVIGGDGITANANDVAITAAQTTITSVLNTGLVIGRDSTDQIKFGTDNTILFRANNIDQVKLIDNVFSPVADSDVDLGTTSLRWKDAFVDSITVTGAADIDGALTVGTGTNPINAGVLTVVNDNADTYAHTLLLVDNEDDTTAGPSLSLYRNSASPADNDVLGKITFNGEDSLGDARTYSNIRTVSSDVTNGTHDGVLHLNVAIDGTQTDVLAVDSTGGYGGLTHTPSGIKTLGNVVSATSTANNAYITLLTIPHANFKAVKASIHITDSTSSEVQTQETVAHYDGLAANYTNYGIIYDGAAAIGSVEVDINSSSIRFRFKNTQGATKSISGSIHAVCHP